MSSRFWAQGWSESESESDDESDDEEAPDARYRYLYSDSEDSDDQRRVVRSAKEKHSEEMRATVDQMKNAMKINDFVSLQDGFEKINKQLEKVMRVTGADTFPNLYIKTLVVLEDFLDRAMANKEARKKMRSGNSKALNSLKQKVKKNNKQYEDLINEFRENPWSEEEEKDADEESDVEEESGTEDVKDPRKKEKLHDKQFTEEDVQDNQSEIGEGWELISKKEKLLDKQSTKEDVQHIQSKIGEGWELISKKDKLLDKQFAKEDVQDNQSERGEGWEKMMIGKEKLQFTKEPSEITWDLVHKKFKEIVAARGRRGTGRFDQVEQLTFLTKLAKTPAQKLQILFSVVSALFDVNPGLSGRMPIHVWKKCVQNMLVILDILIQHPNINVVDDSVEPDEDETRKGADFNGHIRVQGNLVAFFERIETEFFKCLQSIEPHMRECTERLRGEPMFLVLAQKVQEYLKRTKDQKAAEKVALSRLKLIQYKPQEAYDAMKKLVEQSGEGDDESKVEENQGPSTFVVVPDAVPGKSTSPSAVYLMYKKNTCHRFYFLPNTGRCSA
ncbi:hypothetical protein Tsubulata_034372 [Turnera subulata]|uniref:Eukaryotic translation initiation factor 3 subunit C N-terminal domain-containing protein n=1 Tax=Turnera subulata TaxID=218843 RepID=A0A9Q0FU02_9ROSI|nr:hypothetical protein Tsubulata_034372 [Turnera subulata]